VSTHRHMGSGDITSPDPAVHMPAADHFVDWCDEHDRDIDDAEALERWHVELEMAREDAASERWERQELFG
jgi:hypothetical protein